MVISSKTVSGHFLVDSKAWIMCCEGAAETLRQSRLQFLGRFLTSIPHTGRLARSAFSHVSDLHISAVDGKL